MKRLGIGIAVLVLLAGLYLAVHGRRERAEAALVALRAQQEDLQSAVRKAAAGRRHPAAEGELRPTIPSGAPRGALGLLERSPALQADYFAARRASLPFLYGPLFRSLHLAPEQARQLGDLIARHDEEFFDTVSVTPAALHQQHSHGSSPYVRENFELSAAGEWGTIPPATEDESAALAYLAQSDAQFETQVNALAGPGTYAALQQYQGKLQYRDIIDSFGAAMAASDSPLTDEQSGRLADVLSQSTSLLADGVDLATALEGAAKVLSPDQLAILRAQVAEQQTSNELLQAIRRNGGFGTLQKLAAPLLPAPPLH